MKYLLAVIILSLFTACSHTYLVNKSECEEIGSNFLACKKVHKVN